MPEVTSKATVAITLVKKDGSAESIRPGETKTVSYDPDHEHNKQMFAMEALVEGSGSTADRKPSRRSGGKRSRR